METINNLKLNVWVRHSILTGSRTLEQIYTGIKNGSVKDLVNKIRNAQNEKEKDDLKKLSYAFTVSGIFQENRRYENLITYTGLLVLDIDDLQPEKVIEVADHAKSIEYSKMVFVSPSGLGVKIIIGVDSDQNHHETAYKQVVAFYQKELGVKFDEKTKDIPRLCYMSYDENAYFAPNARIFHIIIPEPESMALVNSPTEEFLSKKVGYIIYKVSKNGKFESGNRNNFIHNFACWANRLGMKKDVLIGVLIPKYVTSDFGINEIQSSIKSAYKNTSEFGSFSYPPHVFKNNAIKERAVEVKSEEPLESSELSLDSPFFSEFVHENLPEFMKEIINRLKRREQDVFVIAALTALSGCIEASGLYGNKRYYSPCYSFISAPSASGKRAIDLVTQLVLPTHMLLKAKSEEEKEKYETALYDYEMARRKGDKDQDKPEKPNYETILIPANNSSSQIHEDLEQNGERGLIIETEADTMIKSLDSDFGNYSDFLRKAFEHELISQRRKTDRQYIEMFNPRLAICLGGTPQQLSKLITSVENGLFSRFIYYVYSCTPQWRDVTPVIGNEIPLPELINIIGEKLAVKLLKQREHPLQFTLTAEQWKKLNDVFSKRVAEFSCFVGTEASANIFRLGVTTFRIAMVLTVLRKMENNESVNTATCNDTDFVIAMDLSETFYKHLIYAFKVIKDSDEVLNRQLKRFYDILPTSFDRKTAIEKARLSGIPSHERTLDKYLKRLVEFQYLQKDDYNNYQKAGTIINKIAA